jgi:hypothetical protein
MGIIAPDPRVSERTPQSYGETVGPNRSGQRGPLRFEEGIATDGPVTGDFREGISDGLVTAPDSPNHNNPAVQYKPAVKVMQERAHIGSSSWIDAPSMLGEFVGGVSEPPINFPLVRRSGGRYERKNAVIVGERSVDEVYRKESF